MLACSISINVNYVITLTAPLPRPHLPQNLKFDEGWILRENLLKNVVFLFLFEGQYTISLRSSMLGAQAYIS